MTDWPKDIYDVLKEAGIAQVSYVPDAGQARLIEMCDTDNEIRAIPLATELEGIGIAAGAWLGGQRAALLMQSSGVGNCINAFTLLKNCRFPFLCVVSMRGEFGEGNPWQMPMGQATGKLLEIMGLVVYWARRPEDVRPTMEAAIQIAFSAMNPVAVVLSQQLIGAKTYG
ncbi:MAG: phosphonopyruvate decarboxylase [Alphaproteobacteria bacterium]|nr:MAG: phosphonopyruvate decarboxylase [Alphaproteobacteria bacterium]